MDLALLTLLEDCNYLQLFKYFNGITLYRLRHLSEDDLKAKLNGLLVTIADREEIVAAIQAQIILYCSAQTTRVADIKPKIEKITELGASNKSSASTPDKSLGSNSTSSQSAVVAPSACASTLPNEASTESGGDEPTPVLANAEQETIVPDPIGNINEGGTEASALQNSGTKNSDNRDEGDDEPVIVHEVHGEVRYVGKIIKNVLPTAQVNIDEDIEDAAETEIADSTSSDSEEDLQARDRVCEREQITRLVFKPTPSTISKLKKAKRGPHYLLFSGDFLNRSLSPCRKSARHSETQGPSDAKYPQLAMKGLYRACGTNSIKFLDVNEWTLTNPEEACSNNLCRLLESHCSELEELNIQSNASPPSSFTRLFFLPALKLLTIQFTNDTTEDLNFSFQLQDIILATHGGLEKIVFYYPNHSAFSSFLDVLQSLQPQQLNGLKALHLRHKTPGDIALSKEMCDKLVSLACNRLEDIHLDFCLWDECDESFEAILNRFPRLKKIVVAGCFVTRQPYDPSIVIKFPVLPRLENLELGRSDVFESTFETIHSRPPKKIDRTVCRTEEGGTQATASSPTDQRSTNTFFAVTLKLPALPRLKTLTLGRLFQTEALYFQKMPKLTVFRVCSRWDLSVKLPSDISRVKSFPLIKELQLPDGMQDHTYIRDLMPLFPNLETCWMSLPTVKVLRSFAFAMKNVSSLQELVVDIQFDFPSALEAIFVENLSEIKQSDEEVRQIEALKAYEHWKTYALLHHIDIPHIYVTGETDETIDDQKYNALSILKNLKPKHFHLRHVGRTLRLPQGDAHWNDDSCVFSDTIIGYRRFPFSATAWNLGVKVSLSNFTTPTVPYVTNPSTRVYGLPLNTSTQTIRSKKENHAEFSAVN